MKKQIEIVYGINNVKLEYYKMFITKVKLEFILFWQSVFMKVVSRYTSGKPAQMLRNT